MGSKLEEGKKYDFEIANIKSDGQAVAFAEDGTVVVIDGVTPGDSVVIAEVTDVLEESAFARKISRKERKDHKENLGLEQNDNPYDVDDDDDDDENYDDDD